MDRPICGGRKVDDRIGDYVKHRQGEYEAGKLQCQALEIGSAFAKRGIGGDAVSSLFQI